MASVGVTDNQEMREEKDTIQGVSPSEKDKHAPTHGEILKS